MNRFEICVKCGEQFELKPSKPGYANVCEDCTGLHNVRPLPIPQPSRQHLLKFSKAESEAPTKFIEWLEELEKRGAYEKGMRAMDEYNRTGIPPTELIAMDRQAQQEKKRPTFSGKADKARKTQLDHKT